jgi:hypothetical protein
MNGWQAGVSLDEQINEIMAEAPIVYIDMFNQNACGNLDSFFTPVKWGYAGCLPLSVRRGHL